MNTEVAVEIIRRVANTKLAVKRRVAYPAFVNTEEAVGTLTLGYLTRG